MSIRWREVSGSTAPPFTTTLLTAGVRQAAPFSQNSRASCRERASDAGGTSTFTASGARAPRRPASPTAAPTARAIDDEKIAGAHPQAAHSARVAGRAHRPRRLRAAAGGRRRQERAHAVPLPLALPRPARGGEVQARRRVRRVAARAAPPRARRSASAPTLERQRVLAAIVRLIDQGFFRIGNDKSAKSESTYGLTTIRGTHVKSRRRRCCSSTTSASGAKQQKRAIEDRDVAAIVDAS